MAASRGWKEKFTLVLSLIDGDPYKLNRWPHQRIWVWNKRCSPLRCWKGVSGLRNNERFDHGPRQLNRADAPRFAGRPHDQKPRYFPRVDRSHEISERQNRKHWDCPRYRLHLGHRIRWLRFRSARRIWGVGWRTWRILPDWWRRRFQFWVNLLNLIKKTIIYKNLKKK